MNPKSILAVGSIALDTLETPLGKRTDILGGSATFFAVAASLFAPVNLIGVVGTDFPEEGWQLLRDRGVDLSDVQRVDGKTFRWGARYSEDLHHRETLFTELGVVENFQPRVSEKNRKVDLAYLGNIQPSLQLAVCGELPPSSTIVADTMNLWIEVSREELHEVVQKADIFLLNDEEAVQFTGQTDLEDAAESLLRAGPSTVIIKQGKDGALLATGNSRRHIPVYPGAEVVDPTGAGDSFAGGLLGQIAKQNESTMEEAVIMAAATASYTVEGLGLEGLLKATPEGIRRRAGAISQRMVERVIQQGQRL